MAFCIVFCKDIAVRILITFYRVQTVCGKPQKSVPAVNRGLEGLNKKGLGLYMCVPAIDLAHAVGNFHSQSPKIG